MGRAGPGAGAGLGQGTAGDPGLLLLQRIPGCPPCEHPQALFLPVSQALGAEEVVQASLCCLPAATVVVIRPSETPREGVEVTLKCVVSREAAGSPANFSWLRNEEPWTQGPLETMTLLPVARTDSGRYACRVLTEAHTLLSAPAVLTVLCG